MPTKIELLDEYCQIYDDINKLKFKFESIKQELRNNISLSKTEKEKEKYINIYKKQLFCIKNNIYLKKIYKNLISRQNEIKKILVDNNKVYNITKYKIRDMIDFDKAYPIFNNNINLDINTNLNSYKKDDLTSSINSLLDKYKLLSNNNSDNTSEKNNFKNYKVIIKL